MVLESLCSGVGKNLRDFMVQWGFKKGFEVDNLKKRKRERKKLCAKSQ